MKRARSREKGSALLLSTVVSLVIMGITGAYMAVSLINTKETTNTMAGIQALFTAEAGAAAYIATLNEPIKHPTVSATALTASTFNGGNYVVQDAPLSAGSPYRKLYVTGTWGSVSRSVEVIVSGSPPTPFNFGLYAGNIDPITGKSDPNYILSLNHGLSYVNNPNGTDVGDTVVGDVYSGGSFSAGAAPTSVTGAVVSASGHSSALTSGVTYQDNTTESNFTIPRDPLTGKTSWETTAQSLWSGTRQDSNGVTYIDVAHDISSMGKTGTWVDNSSATQITDQSQPSHIFRMDPTSDYSSANRTNTYEFTPSAKHDYYLEDPTSTQINGNNLSVPVNGDTTASGVNVQPNGNNAVYFIDGNMRVSGEQIKSYQLTPVDGAGNLSMTFVVKGNVSLTDNILYPTWQSTNDAVAIIAVTDPAFPNTTAANFQGSTSALLTGPFKNSAGAPGTVADFINQFNATAQAAENSGHNIPQIDMTQLATDPNVALRASAEYNKAYGSGNVYYGDPGSGTVEHFEAYMYAENNFYGTDLDSAGRGTQYEEVFGNMTAGNQVNILRTGAEAGYLPLRVTLDRMIIAGGHPPPALPSSKALSGVPYVILSWRQVP